MLQKCFILVYFFLDTTIIIFSYSIMKHTFTLKGQFSTSSLWTAEWIRVWNMEQPLPALARDNSPYSGVLLTSMRFIIHWCISDVRRTDLNTFLEHQLALLFVLVTAFLMSLEACSPFQLWLWSSVSWCWHSSGSVLQDRRESLCVDLCSSDFSNGSL